MPELSLSDADRQALLELAHAAIEAHVRGEPPPPLPTGGADLQTVLGVFVTLHRRGKLRGCIGHIEGHLPLAEGVRTLAVTSASRDHRFAPVSADELDELDVEISVLSPLEPADPDRIEIGVHGLMIELGSSRGLLLPQVASERGWDAKTFLEATCQKARLPGAAWRDPAATLSWFSCLVFGDPERT